MKIAYLAGDATRPAGAGPKIIVHICNDAGKWGKGFVLAVSRRWKAPEAVYKKAFGSGQKPNLGDVQFVPVEPGIVVANLIGQAGIRSPRDKNSPPPIRYDAVRKGLKEIASHALATHASVHMPRIGCGLAGGNWEDIEPIIAAELAAKDIPTSIYDFTTAAGVERAELVTAALS